MTEHEISILLLESSATDAKRIKDELGMENVHFKSKRVMSQKSYLKALDDLHPDVILTDYKLLHFDALAAIEIAKEKSPGTPVIVITSLDDTETAVRCMQAGAADYILKKNIGRLVPAIQQALQNGKSGMGTERKNSQCKDVDKYRLMIEKANESVLVAQDGVLKFVNPQTLELLGRSEDDVTGKPFLNLIHPDDQKMVIERYKKRLTGETVPGNYSFRIVDKAGKTKWVEIGSASLSWDDKPATLNFLKDITERRQMEFALNSLATSFANLSGKELYIAVAKHLAVTLNMDYAFIGELAEDKNMVHVLGGFGLGKSLEPFEYNLVNSPCENVAGQKLRCYSEKVRALFPKSQLLKEWKIEGFIGTPLFASSGEALGVAILLDKKPIINQALAKSMLSVFSDRIAAEIERKRAEKALRESEEKFRNLFHKSMDGIFIHDLQGKILDVNQKALDEFEYTENEIRAMSITQLHPKEEEERSRRAFEIIAKEGTVEFEIQFRKKSGKTFPAEVSSTILEIAGQRVVQGVFRDISERKQAEKALHQSEERYRRLFDTSPNPIIAHCEGKVISANTAAARFAGAKKTEELIGKNVIDFVHPDYREIVRQRTIETTKNHTPSKLIEEKFITLHNEIKDVEVASAPFLYQGKDAVQVVFRDITERKQAEAALKENEEKFRSIVENSHAGISLIDNKYKFLYVNPRFTEITGYRKEELLGEDFKKVLDQKSIELVSERYERRQRGEKVPSVYEFDILRKDGSLRHVQIRSATVESADNSVRTVAQILDISEQQELKEQLLYERDLLHALMDNIPDTIYFKDREARFMAINKAHARQMGLLSPKEAKGKTDFDFFTEEHARPAFEDEQKIIATGEPLIGKIEKITPRGKAPQWVSATKVPIRNQKGEITGLVGISRDITEQILLEKALEQSEAMYRSLIEQSNDAIYLLYGKNFELINKRFTDMFGYTLEETNAPEFNFMQLVAPRSVPIIEERMRRMKAGEKLNPIYEFTAINKAGKEIECEVGASYVQYKGNTATQGIIRDISERKRAEKALEESELKFRSTIESAPDAIILSDEKGHILSWNAAAKNMFQYQKEEILNQPFQLLIPDRYKKRFKKGFQKIRKTGKGKFIGRTIEMEGRRKDGVEIPIEFSVATWRTDNKTFFSTIIRDTSERKEAQAQLAKQGWVIEQASESIVITDIHGNIEYANPAFEKVTGYGIWEVIGENPRILKSDVHDPLFYEELWQTITGGNVWHGIFTNRRKDGTLYYEDAIIFPIKDPAGNIINFAAVKRDITQERILEDQFRQAQKMEAIGTLAGGIAHDFNNILGAIIGYTELALDDVEENSILYQNMENVLTASIRAKELVKQILTFSRLDKLERKPIQLSSVVKETIKLLRASLPATVDIISMIRAESAVILADPVQIQQIILNFSTNAAHAMREQGGQLRIFLDEIDLDEKAGLKYQGLAAGHYVDLAVSDTGEGIEQAILDRIFDPFFTTKEVGEGTGMGLSVIHGIVQRLEGKITVESKVGKGTTFHVLLPRVKKEAAEQQKKGGPPQRGDETILYIDDEEALVRIAEKKFTNLGYRIVGKTSSPEALELFQQDPDQFDLVITDQTLPKITGKELAQQILHVRPEMPIILCTGYSSAITKEDALTMGIREFMLKPLSLQHLLKVVRRILDEKKTEKAEHIVNDAN